MNLATTIMQIDIIRRKRLFQSCSLIAADDPQIIVVLKADIIVDALNS